MVSMWLLGAMACKKAPVEPTPAPDSLPAAAADMPEPAWRPEPTPPPTPPPVPVMVLQWPEGAEDIQRALAVRDPEPVCADVEALAPEPLVALLFLVEHVSMPPTVPMRAANCVVNGHAEHAVSSLVQWAGDPNTLGLAKLLAMNVDAMPVAVSVVVAEAALVGPHAEVMREAVQGSVRPELSGLAATP